MIFHETERNQQQSNQQNPLRRRSRSDSRCATGSVSEGQGTENCLDQWAETAQDLHNCVGQHSRGSEGPLGKVKKAAKDGLSRSTMDYFLCGVVEFRGLPDALGTACGRFAGTLCYDCGTSLCVNHTQHCELCRENFCPSCLSFHLNEHSKPAERQQRTQRTRRTA
jgi:hypothetical protein